MKRRPARKELSLKECYDILKLKKGASLDEVKHAYRVRAFELHPDLNPGNPMAGNDFQTLNEAYVLLTGILQEEETRNAARAEAEARRREDAAREQEERAARERERSEQRAEREKVREKAREEARAEERAERERARIKKEQEWADRERAREEARRLEKERAAREAAERAEREKLAREEAERAEREKGSAAGQSAAAGHGGAADSQSAAAEDEAGRKRAAESAYGQGDVLHDILNDPFARRVFEDIYSEINRQGAANAGSAPHGAEGAGNNSAGSAPSPPPTAEAHGKTLKFEWGDNKNGVTLKNGVGGAVKGWLRNQIDEEQIFKLPASNLFPGARIRLRIRRGFSEELTTIEIVLPRDFVIGKPVRLRGLGKKVGPWQGDMYLRFEVAS